MIPDDGSEAVLIECNPRPVPVHHLGRHVGVDLGAAFARLLNGETLAGGPLFADRELDVVLFPHALNRALHVEGSLLDMPEEDPGLVRHVASRIAARQTDQPTRLAA